MLSLAITFLIIALLAAAVGFGGLAGPSTVIPKLIFVVFTALFAVALVCHVIARRWLSAPRE